MFKIERAIIMAAGKGTRLLPITEKVPKPLIKVNGISMIETIITSLKKNNINEIYIVVGYIKEEFSYLKDKYKNISFIENPYPPLFRELASYAPNCKWQAYGAYSVPG